jgi:branched-chain amino acid transport system ATP-binding protein
LIVDRDYRKVLAHSDQALVLQKGQVELAGPSAQVASDPALPKLLGV